MDDKLAVVVIGSALIGLGIGIAVILLMMTKKTTYVEVVRDENGRIMQIIQVDDVLPLSGRWMFNVTEPVRLVEKTEP